ncbi:MAG: hypothetical protein O3C21_07680 [Verrucomicrobia bacterium]|nr:hypothetical protein [Verrucomicrobiota bacterium]
MKGKGAGGLQQFRWVAICIVAFFCVVDACALTFWYVEGDDARSVIYALLGVHNGIYEPFHYHSMSSLMLSLLPKQEPLVRVVAVGTSALAAITYLLLVARIAWHWAMEAGLPRWLAAGVLASMPLLIPEFAFLGLVYEPVMVSMSIVLLGHLLVRPAFAGGNSKGNKWRIVVAALLFGFGVSFRWDAGFYGCVIAMDLLLTGWKKHMPKRGPLALIAKVSAWGCLALAATVGSLAASGYPPPAIIETYQWVKETVAEVPPLMERLADGVTFLTPAVVCLLGAGVLSVLLSIRNSWRVIALLLASAPLFIVVGNPSFCGKAFLTVMPALFLTMLYGAVGARNAVGKFPRNLKRLTAVVALLLVLVPWVVGIQWKRSGTARGPGFAFSSVLPSGKSSGPRPALAGGLGVPTPEGPRPIWGFAYVLFGGEWRDFVLSMNRDWNSAVDLAIAKGLPIHQDSDTGIVPTRLVEQGYVLQTARLPLDRSGAPDFLHHRLYKHSQTGKSMEVILVSGLDQHLKEGRVPDVFSQLDLEEVVIVYVFPSRLHELQVTSKGTVTALGPLTALWKRPLDPQ